MLSLFCEAISGICVSLTIANIVSRWVLLNCLSPVQKFAEFATQHWKNQIFHCFKAVRTFSASAAHFPTELSLGIGSTHPLVGCTPCAASKIRRIRDAALEKPDFQRFKAVRTDSANAAHFPTDLSCCIVSTYLGMGAQLVAAQKIA
jgi:hypothetical protein